MKAERVPSGAREAFYCRKVAGHCDRTELHHWPFCGCRGRSRAADLSGFRPGPGLGIKGGVRMRFSYAARRLLFFLAQLWRVFGVRNHAVNVEGTR